MKIELISAPAEEPITLAEAKAQLRVDHDDEDALIESLIIAAREVVESKLERALITQTWAHYFDFLPGDYGFELQPGVSSIVSVQYQDLNDTTQTVDPANYVLTKDAVPQIRLSYSGEWPAALEYSDAVKITVVVGYGDRHAVPEAIKQAIKLLVSHWYENREAVVIGTITATLPLAVDLLLRRYKVVYL